MTDSEKKAYKDGYQRALKETMDELSRIHSQYPNRIEMRKIVDLIWAAVKEKHKKSRSGEIFNGGF